MIKVIWGSDWDRLLEARQGRHPHPVKRMDEIAVDGDYQKFKRFEDGAYIREHFFGTDPRLAERWWRG